MTLELRERHDLDGSGDSLAFLIPAARLSLPEVLYLAAAAGRTIDVCGNGRYMITYCGGAPYWWPPGTHSGDMHQVGSCGWCHHCRTAGEGYVHHLDYDVELGVLANEARHDRALAGQCEADGLTPEQYAAEVAGRAVPLESDSWHAAAVHDLGVNADGLAEFAVDMQDMTTRKVAVPAAAGAPGAAARLAEEQAFAQALRPLQGQARPLPRVPVTREREFLRKYPHLREPGPREL